MERGLAIQKDIFLQLHALGITPETHSKVIDKIESLLSKIVDYCTPEQLDTIAQALIVMIKAHWTQWRSDGTPYYEHPIDVATKLLELMQDPTYEAITAALFHDIIEDQSANFIVEHGLEVKPHIPEQVQASSTMSDEYRPPVTSYVHAVTNPDFEEMLAADGIDRDHPQYRDHMHPLYADHVAEIIQDPVVCVLKLSDFLTNASSLPNLPDGKRKSTLIQKYRPVVYIFIDRINNTSNPVRLKDPESAIQQLTACAELLI